MSIYLIVLRSSISTLFWTAELAWQKTRPPWGIREWLTLMFVFWDLSDIFCYLLFFSEVFNCFLFYSVWSFVLLSQLSYCIAQFMEKDATLTELVSHQRSQLSIGVPVLLKVVKIEVISAQAYITTALSCAHLSIGERRKMLLEWEKFFLSMQYKLWYYIPTVYNGKRQRCARVMTVESWVESRVTRAESRVESRVIAFFRGRVPSRVLSHQSRIRVIAKVSRVMSRVIIAQLVVST